MTYTVAEAVHTMLARNDIHNAINVHLCNVLFVGCRHCFNIFFFTMCGDTQPPYPMVYDFSHLFELPVPSFCENILVD